MQSSQHIARHSEGLSKWELLLLHACSCCIIWAPTLTPSSAHSLWHQDSSWRWCPEPQETLSITSVPRIRLPCIMELTPRQLGFVWPAPALPKESIVYLWFGPCLGMTTLLFPFSGPRVSLGGLTITPQ